MPTILIIGSETLLLKNDKGLATILAALSGAKRVWHHSTYSKTIELYPEGDDEAVVELKSISGKIRISHRPPRANPDFDDELLGLPDHGALLGLPEHGTKPN